MAMQSPSVAREDAGEGLPVVGRLWVGCLVTIACVPIGIALAWLQNRNIEHAWSYCSNLPSAITPDIANTGQVGLIPFLVRAVVYSACLPLGVFVGQLIVRRRAGWVRAVSAIIIGVVVCGAVFVGDYAIDNGMRPGLYIASRCPAGHAPWWPSWLPLHVSGGVTEP